jgi:hypothetical protein
MKIMDKADNENEKFESEMANGRNSEKIMKYY